MSELQFSVASVKALIMNFDDFKDYRFHVRPPIIGIKTDRYEEYSDDFKLESNKSNRGRKKKIKVEKKKFKFNVSFIIRLTLHRPPKRDALGYTSTVCLEHPNCEICYKPYTMRVFNGGKVICVGIINQDKSDFHECARILAHYLADCRASLGTDAVDPGRYAIVNLKSTLENYQFNVGRHINLYKLQSILINNSSAQIINVDFASLYKFLAQSITKQEYNFNADWLLDSLILRDRVRVNFVNRDAFVRELYKINLHCIEAKFSVYWEQFQSRNRGQLHTNYIEFVKYNLLKSFIIHELQPMSDQCDYFDHSLFESIIFKESKNTLMVKKRIRFGGQEDDINYRIFITGIINIQGGKSVITTELARQKILEMLTDDVLYDINVPPMITRHQILGHDRDHESKN